MSVSDLANHRGTDGDDGAAPPNVDTAAPACEVFTRIP